MENGIKTLGRGFLCLHLYCSSNENLWESMVMTDACLTVWGAHSQGQVAQGKSLEAKLNINLLELQSASDPSRT